MGLVRDFGITIPAITPTILITCAETISTAASTVAVPDKGNSTADLIVSVGTQTTVFGDVIDRIGAPLGTLYNVVQPAVWLKSTRGSTEADRKLTIGCKLQHGDSSAGGDMADYSTQNQPADRTYFGTGRTCDMLNWEFAGRSTGPLFAVSNPAYYDLRAAKRYIRVGLLLLKDKVTTESSGDEHAHVGATMTFLAGESLPQLVDDIKSPFSTTTSTI